MKKSEEIFSPAPWSKIDHSWSDVSVKDADGRTICISSISEDDESDELGEAEVAARQISDMHLISQAPAMYAQLERSYLFCQRLAMQISNEKFSEIREDWNKVMTASEEVLAAARGEKTTNDGN